MVRIAQAGAVTLTKLAGHARAGTDGALAAASTLAANSWAAGAAIGRAAAGWCASGWRLRDGASMARSR